MTQPSALQLTMKAQASSPAGKGLGLLLSASVYAALALTLGGLWGVDLSLPAWGIGLALLILLRLCPAKWICYPVLALSAAALFLWRDAFEGLLWLLNRLFAASEAVNAYEYQYFVLTAADPARCGALALLPLSALLAALACAAAGRGRRIWAAVLFALTAGGEIYLGLTPGVWRNLLLFAALGLLLLKGRSLAGHGAVLAGMAAAAVLILLIAPRPIPEVEAFSEDLRDRFDTLFSPAAEEVELPQSGLHETHGEDRFHIDDLIPPSGAPEYDHQTHDQLQITLPISVSYGKIIMISLAILALLILPFLPFAWLDRRRRRAEALQREFDGPDGAAAVRAMFRHLMRYCCLCGLDPRNRPYSACTEDVEALAGRAVGQRFAAALPLWHRAAYSPHPISEEEREQVRSLLREADASLYPKADRKTRFRLSYLECLHTGGNQ